MICFSCANILGNSRIQSHELNNNLIPRLFAFLKFRFSGHSYAFEGDQDEALHESRIDNFVLESMNEVCDSETKSESKIFHILASKIEAQRPEAGNLVRFFPLSPCRSVDVEFWEDKGENSRYTACDLL